MADAVTIEKVKDSWSKITNMENGQHFSKPSEATMALVSALESIREGVKNGDNEEDVNVCDYTEKDLILYALGGKKIIHIFCCKSVDHFLFLQLVHLLQMNLTSDSSTKMTKTSLHYQLTLFVLL